MKTQDRTIRDVNTEVIEKMDKFGYGLLKDGDTFYEKGYELNPRDSITFTMRQAYKIVSLKQPEKQEIEIAEEMYSVNEFIYHLMKYNEDVDKKKYTKSQIATNIAKAMLNFFDETDVSY